MRRRREDVTYKGALIVGEDQRAGCVRDETGLGFDEDVVADCKADEASQKIDIETSLLRELFETDFSIVRDCLWDLVMTKYI